MILAGLVAESIAFGERDLLELPDDEVQLLERWALRRCRPPEVMPYLEVWASDDFRERRFVVRPLVPCVTVLP